MPPLILDIEPRNVIQIRNYPPDDQELDCPFRSESARQLQPVLELLETYQLDFTTPGILPSRASLRKQMRQRPKRRM